jgi:hypothetical protein
MVSLSNSTPNGKLILKTMKENILKKKDEKETLMSLMYLL